MTIIDVFHTYTYTKSHHRGTLCPRSVTGRRQLCSLQIARNLNTGPIIFLSLLYGNSQGYK